MNRELGKVRRQKFIERNDCRDNLSSCVFVFGDNMVRLGYGGQAANMRGEINVVGVPTKRFPGADDDDFFYDDDLDDPLVKNRIDAAFHEIAGLISDGIDVVFPEDGLGTGLADLPNRSPRIKAYIDAWIRAVENLSEGNTLEEYLDASY